MSDPYAGIGAEDPYAGIGAPVAQQSKPKRPPINPITGAMANVERGLGIGDEMAAGFGVVGGLLSGVHRFGVDQPGNVFANNAAMLGQAYENELGAQRRREDTYSAEHPNAAALARGTGMAATVAVPGGQGAVAPNAFARMGQAATGAAATGAAYAAADRGSIPERIQAASEAATNPLNLVFGAIGARAGAPPKAKPGKAIVPTLPELNKGRKAAYKDVENSGHTYGAESFSNFVSGLKTSLAKERFDPDFHANVRLMLDKLDAKVKAGYSPTLAEMDDLKKFVNQNVTGNGNIRRLAGVITRGIDTFIDSQGGNAAELVGKARALYKAETKVAEVTKAVNKAERQARRTGSGGNIDNTLRAKMDQILEKNPYLTADERAALDNIVMGDKGQNAMRQVGKFSPSGNGLSQWLNLGAVAAGGPGALVIPAMGAIAKSKADNITRQKVAQLIDLMAAGGTREQLLAAQKTAATVEGPAGSALRKMITARISRVGGVTSAAPSAQPAR